MYRLDNGVFLTQKQLDKMRDEILEHFNNYRFLYSISGIELAANVSKKCLDHFLTGRRSLTDLNTIQIHRVLVGIRFKTD